MIASVVHYTRSHKYEETVDESHTNNRILIGDHMLAYFPTIGKEKTTINFYIENTLPKVLNCYYKV